MILWNKVMENTNCWFTFYETQSAALWVIFPPSLYHARGFTPISLTLRRMSLSLKAAGSTVLIG